MILVTGAMEELGREVVRQLRARGVACTAFVQDEAHARTMLGADVPLVVGEWGDYASVVAAVQGMDAVFLYSSPHLNQLVHEMQLIEAANKAKVKHIVKISLPQGVMTADHRAHIPSAHAHWQIEEKLRHAGRGSAAYTIFNVNPLQQPFWKRAVGMINHHGRLQLPLDNGALNLVDARDVASAAAVALTDKAHYQQTYALTGPAALTGSQLATAYSQATGRTIGYRTMPISLLGFALRREGIFSPFLMAHEALLLNAYRQGAAETISPDLATLLGRAPRTVGDYLGEQAAVLAPVLPPPTPAWPKWAAVAGLLLAVLLLRKRRKPSVN